MHPNIPGVPWWGAVLIAVVASLIGFALDSGGQELSGLFSAFFVFGCLAAVLAVRRSGVFTAVIQPPLILFVVVPGAYYVMHSAEIQGMKDILINCGYPLIERFPLMFFTSAAVLLIGGARWYFGNSTPQEAPAAEAAPSAGGRISAKLSAFLGGTPHADPSDRDAQRRHSAERRPTRSSKTAAERADPAARRARAAKRADGPSRSRHARPPDTEIIEAVGAVDRPRRRRPRPSEPPPADEPRRRPRASSGRDPRAAPPGERRTSKERTERRERDRPDRNRDRDRRDRPESLDRERPQRRSRSGGWSGPAERGDWSGPAERDGWSGPGRDGYEPLEPHRRSAASSHHPVSRVRYRGADESADSPEYRPRRRPPRDHEPDRWEYDI